MSDEEKKDGTAEQTAAGEKASPKRSKQKTRMIAGVVAAVVIVAAVGLFVWHEQPSFCNAICHTPMDPYLPTYEAEPGQPAQDKWGNEIPDASGMMAATHRVEADTNCLGCHVPTIGEQVSEGLAWASGDYEVIDTASYQGVLKERGMSDLTEARGIADEEFCLGSGCHDMTREELTELTADRAFNPHDASHGEVACGTCHKAHRQSVMYCSKCHDAATASVPEGWVTFQEAERLESR